MLGLISILILAILHFKLVRTTYLRVQSKTRIAHLIISLFMTLHIVLDVLAGLQNAHFDLFLLLQKNSLFARSKNPNV